MSEQEPGKFIEKTEAPRESARQLEQEVADLEVKEKLPEQKNLEVKAPPPQPEAEAIVPGQSLEARLARLEEVVRDDPKVPVEDIEQALVERAGLKQKFREAA